jgi:flagellar biosynthesis regulator FlaF
VKATTKSSDYNIDALLSRISKLENQLQNGDFAKSVNETTAIKSTAQVDANAIESRLQDRFDEKFDEKTKSLAKRLDVLENEMNSLKNQASKIAQAPKAESYAPKTENYASKTESNAQKTESVKAQKEDLTFGFKAAENAPKKTESVAKTESVSGQEAVPTAPQSVETAQNAQNSESGGEFKSSVPDRRIWGTFLKSLREGGNSILWVVCQELDAKVTCGKLTIFVNNEREQMAVTKKENFEKIKSTLATICNYNVEIVRKGEEVDTFENDVEKMKVDFAKLDIED